MDVVLTSLTMESPAIMQAGSIHYIAIRDDKKSAPP